MIQDDIISMAKEAGIEKAFSLKDNQILIRYNDGGLERFAALVAAAEREAFKTHLAEIAHDMMPTEVRTVLEFLDSAIRARGETK